jgi:hypothetical protein
MPTIVEHVQKRFNLSIIDGLVQATVDIIGAGSWVECCPLCGCSHQILGVNESSQYIPLCQTQPTLFKAQLVVWLKQYPEVRNFTSLFLIPRMNQQEPALST